MSKDQWVYAVTCRDMPRLAEMWSEEAKQSTPQEQDPSNDVTADEVRVIDRVGHVEVLPGFVWAFETFSNIIS